MRKFWWLLSVLFVFQCSDDDPAVCKLASYTDMWSYRRMDMGYDKNGRPLFVQETDEDGNELPNDYRREFWYDELGRIERMKVSFDYPNLDPVHEHEFEYSENKIVQKVYWTPGIPEVNWMITYTLDLEGKVIEFYEEMDSRSPYSETYEYESGNIVKATDMNGSIKEYEYDRFKNPLTKGKAGMLFGYQPFFVLESQNENNIVKVFHRNDENAPRYFYAEYFYKYNSSGSPVKRLIKNSGNTLSDYSVISVYEYECEE
jgi:hypothetical protein